MPRNSDSTPMGNWIGTGLAPKRSRSILTQRQKSALAHVRFAPRSVWSLAEAREALERMVGVSHDWGRLDEYLMSYLADPSMRATVMASSFASVLEMVREGALEVHQHQAFAPIFLRKRADETGAQTPGTA